MVPGEGSLSPSAVLLATCVSCRPCSLWMVSRVDRPWECLLTVEVFGWALCLFEEESQLLSYFKGFAGVLIITYWMTLNIGGESVTFFLQ